MNEIAQMKEIQRLTHMILDAVDGYKKIALILMSVEKGQMTSAQGFDEITTACEEVNERLFYYQNTGKYHDNRTTN